jgi:hypothetical protein
MLQVACSCLRCLLIAGGATRAAFFKSVWPNTSPIFTTDQCSVTLNEIEITCTGLEGFAGPLAFAVYIDGVVSAPLVQPAMSYADPYLAAIAVISVNVSSYSTTTTTYTSTVTTVNSFAAATLGPTPGTNLDSVLRTRAANWFQ